MIQFKLIFPGYRKHLFFLDDQILHFLKESEVKAYTRIHFAIHEVLINSIKMIESYPPSVSENVEICLTIDREWITITIVDWMGGINASKEEVLSIKEGEDFLSESGRGILLVDHLADEYHWEVLKNSEFKVYMKFKLEG